MVDHVEQVYGVVYSSIAKLLRLTQKWGNELASGEKKSPKYDESVVQQHNQMISDWLEENHEEIHQGKIRVFALDECHVCAGDICGYGWGDRQERREVDIDNYRHSQAYYGALDCLSGEVILAPYQTANSSSTIDFIKHLQSRSQGTQIVLVWDGASYHRSQEFRDFLAQLNNDQQWNVHCLRFAQRCTIRKSN